MKGRYIFWSGVGLLLLAWFIIGLIIPNWGAITEFFEGTSIEKLIALSAILLILQIIIGVVLQVLIEEDFNDKPWVLIGFIVWNPVIIIFSISLMLYVGLKLGIPMFNEWLDKVLSPKIKEDEVS